MRSRFTIQLELFLKRKLWGRNFHTVYLYWGRNFLNFRGKLSNFFEENVSMHDTVKRANLHASI